MQIIPMIDQIPYFYKKISEIYPSKPWIEWVEKIDQTRKAFPQRAGQAEIDNWFSFALTRWERQQVRITEGHEWATLVGAMQLAYRVSTLCEAVRNGGVGPRELENRFRGAIQNPSDLRAIHFELFMAETLKARDCQIIWPLENKGDETFDLLVKPPDGLPEFELECKSFAGDKGASITLEAGQRLLESFTRILGVEGLFQLFPTHPGLSSILTIKLEKEIPKDERKLIALANSIISVLKNEDYSNFSSFEIKHSYCEISGNPDDPDACYDASLKLPGAVLAFSALGSASKGWKGVRIVYSGKFTLFEKAEETAKKAAKKQLTGTRPGAIALQFINETAELIRNSNVPGNKYQALAEKIFTKEDAALVVFASDIEARPILPAVSPYAPSAFMAEFCTFAAFDNQTGKYPNAKLKLLFK